MRSAFRLKKRLMCSSSRSKEGWSHGTERVLMKLVDHIYRASRDSHGGAVLAQKSINPEIYCEQTGSPSSSTLHLLSVTDSTALIHANSLSHLPWSHKGNHWLSMQEDISPKLQTVGLYLSPWIRWVTLWNCCPSKYSTQHKPCQNILRKTDCGGLW